MKRKTKKINNPRLGENETEHECNEVSPIKMSSKSVKDLNREIWNVLLNVPISQTPEIAC